MELLWKPYKSQTNASFYENALRPGDRLAWKEHLRTIVQLNALVRRLQLIPGTEARVRRVKRAIRATFVSGMRIVTYTHRPVHAPRVHMPWRTVESFRDDECSPMFRLLKPDLRRFMNAIQVPANFVIRDADTNYVRNSFSGETSVLLSSLALYADMKNKEARDADEGSDDESISKLEAEDSDNERFVAQLNADSDEELVAGSDEEVDLKGLLEVSDSEDEVDDQGGNRDEAAIQAKLKAKKRKAREERNDFDHFFMPKLSVLRRAAGLLPPLAESKEKKKKKAFGAEVEVEEVKKGVVASILSDWKDSGKELLAYWTGEEMYETKPLGCEDIGDIIGAALWTNWRRAMINLVPWGLGYSLNLRGFSRYYKPASKTLLLACRSRHVKPFQIADLLEEGADPNTVEVGTENTPLHYLVRRGNIKAVRFLVEAGANVLAFDAQHRNALMCACDTNRTGDQVRIVRYFLSLKMYAENLEYLEIRDTGGNTAAINAIFKGNVWILRELLNAGARVTEDWKEMGYESAHHVAMWVYAAGLLSDIDQLTPKARQDPEAMGCCWHYFSFQGHYTWAPLLFLQTIGKYQNELCARMCQNAKRAQDKMTYAPRPRKAVLRMTDDLARQTKQRRLDKEVSADRRDRRAKKLVNRKLDHEVKEVEEWNRQRVMFAKRIDGEFKKGLRGQGDKATHEYIMKQYEKDGEKFWEKQNRTGSFYMSNAPPIADTNVKTIALEAVLQEKHNRTHNPSQQIHVYGGSPTENAYAKASWVVKDDAAKRADLQRMPEDNDKVDTSGKGNGWKLAARTEFGFIDRNTQWAKNKVARPFVIPPTEEDVYLSDGSHDDLESLGSDDDRIIPVSPGPQPVSSGRKPSPTKSVDENKPNR